MINLILFLAGSILLTIAAVRELNEKAEKAPKHADRRIVKKWGDYWIEEYHAFPGWSLKTRYESLEEAENAKATWDRIHNE